MKDVDVMRVTSFENIVKEIVLTHLSQVAFKMFLFFFILFSNFNYAGPTSFRGTKKC